MSSGIEAAGFALKTLPLFIETSKPYITLRWLQRYVTEKLTDFKATCKALLMGITEEKEFLLLLAGDGWENANFQAKFALHMGERITKAFIAESTEFSKSTQNHLDILDTRNHKSYTIPLFEINYRNFDPAHLSIVFQRPQIDKMMKRFQSLALEHAELLNSRQQKRISTSSTQMHIAHKTRRVEGCGHQPAPYFEAIKHLPHSPDNPKAFSSGNSSPSSSTNF